MALLHRSWLRSNDGEGLFEAGEIAFSNWLQSRSHHVDIDQIGKDGKFAAVGGNHNARRIEIVDGQSKILQLSQSVVNDSGKYFSDLTLRTNGKESWAQLDVHAPRENSSFDSPRLARELVSEALRRQITLTTGNHFNRLTEGFQVIRIDKVGRFIDEVLEQPDRNTSAIVVGASNSHHIGKQLETFERFIDRSVGVASLWMLSPEALEEYNSLVRREYQVFPSSIRVFQPDLDLENLRDSRRHRFVPYQELFGGRSRSGKYISRKLYHLAREASLHQELPSELEDASSKIAKRIHELRTQDESPKPPIWERLRNQKSVWEFRASKPVKDKDSQSVKPPAPTLKPPAEEPKHVAEVNKTGQTPTPLELSNRTTKPGNAQQIVDKASGLPDNRVEKSNSDLDQQSTNKGEVTKSTEVHLLKTKLEKLEETIREVSHLVGIEQFKNDAIDLVFALGEKFEAATEKATKIRGYADELRQDNNELQLELENNEKYLDELVLELDDFEENEFRLQKENQHLRLELQKRSAPQEAFFVKESEQPKSMKEILKKLKNKEVPHVRFTGDERCAIILDDRTNSDFIARMTWLTIEALEDYASKPEQDRDGMKNYMNSGYSLVPPNRFSPTETASVRDSQVYSRHRYLPVPTSINESGYEYMWAHFKIARDGGKAPRLHYLDATNIDGKIYIGYIGEHLQTRMTS